VAALVLFFTEPGIGDSSDDQPEPFGFSITPFGAQASFRF